MSVLAAVETVLSEAGTQLNYHEITKRILDRGLWTSEGKTPEATVRGILGTDIKKKGSTSRFLRVRKGLFALRVASSRDGGIAVATVAPATVLAPELTHSTEAKTVSFADAAEQVLQRFGQRTPMHYRTVTDKAVSLGLVSTSGQTPSATLYAQVLTEMTRKSKRGETPRFTKHGKGLIGLSVWATNGLGSQIEQHNSKVRKELHTRLSSMPPADFEALIGELLAALGFEHVILTSYSGDGGIDVRGTLVVGDVIHTRMAVQVKRWSKNVQIPVVQQVRGGLGTHEQGLIITTSDFSTGARTEAQRGNAVPVALMNGEQLVALLVEHDIGVDRVSYDLIELAQSDNK